MSGNISFLIFCTFCFLQVECRQHTTESIQNVTTTQLSEDNLSPRQKLINNGLKNFSISAEPTLQYAREVFKEVLADVLTFPNQAEEFNLTVTRLRSFINKSENLNTNLMLYETFQLMYELRSWISVYADTDVSKESSTIDKVFKLAFERNHIIALQREYEVNFRKYLNIFYKEFDEYWSSLNAAEQTADIRFSEWYQELKRLGVSGDIIWLLWSM